MPRVSEEHTEARRGQILQAALRCFARKGVHSTTVRDICAEAGLSAGALYNYYPAKQDIIEAVFDASLAENERMFASIAEIEDPLDGLEVVRDASFGPFDDPVHGEMAKAAIAIIAEAVRDPRLAKRYAALQDDMATRLGGLVAAAQAAGQLDATADPEQAGRILLAIHEGWRIQKVMDPDLDSAAFLSALDLVLGQRKPE